MDFPEYKWDSKTSKVPLLTESSVADLNFHCVIPRIFYLDFLVLSKEGCRDIGMVEKTNKEVEQTSEEGRASDRSVDAIDLLKSNDQSKETQVRERDTRSLVSEGALPDLKLVGDTSPKVEPGKKDDAGAKVEPGKKDDAEAKVEPGKKDDAGAKVEPGKKDDAEAKVEPAKSESDKAAQPRDSADPAKDISPEGQKLLDLARTRIPDAGRPNTAREMKQFENDISQFERRAKEQNVAPEQIKETYAQITRLLESKGTQQSGVQGERNRIRLAEQVLAKAAEPTSSDQGKNNTCNVTTIENRLYTREPAVAAKLVADMALTGQHTTADGTNIKLHPESLRPDREAQQNNQRGNAVRSFAGQIFQVTAANLPYAKAAAEGKPEAKFEFRQGENGARLLYHGDKSKLNQEEKAELGSDHPIHAASLENLVAINKMLTGRQEPQVFLAHQSEHDSKSGNAFSDVKDFENKIAELARTNQLPAILSVHAMRLPGEDELLKKEALKHGVRPDQMMGPPGEDNQPGGPESDGHVVTVTGYTPGKDGQPGKVTFDNQLGNEHDRGKGKEVSVADLFAATRDRMAMERVRDVEKALKKGEVSPRDARELIRDIGKEREHQLQQGAKFDAEQQRDLEQLQNYIRTHTVRVHQRHRR